ncbi:MAG: hypothetical protein R6W93_10975 [Candidatus Limnocylindrales bacterium]
MSTRDSLWRVLERLISFLPSGPEDQPGPTSIPDPNEPGISAAARRATEPSGP